MPTHRPISEFELDSCALSQFGADRLLNEVLRLRAALRDIAAQQGGTWTQLQQRAREAMEGK